MYKELEAQLECIEALKIKCIGLLDVVCKEDDCRVRDKTAALNFAWFRKMALALLKPTGPYSKEINSI